jgi:glycosyltransferase involved in cell wall biosynthesis
MLARAIESIVKQDGTVRYELVVVDNNCTDDTAQVVKQYAQQSPIIRYVFEAKQGVSHGRNAGIAAAHADLIAFTDDDVLAESNWVERVKAVFDTEPDHGCIGGRVLPIWPGDQPRWLDRGHWSPLALLDYGEAQTIDAINRKCLVTANMSARRSVFEQIGHFSPQFQKTNGSTCSVEDRELQERYWKAGGRCRFDPSMVVYASIQPERLNKSYHRRWHYSHGQMHANLRDPSMESSAFRILGIPGHVYRSFLTESAAAIIDLLRLQKDDAFACEIRARFWAGFMCQRLRDLHI